ncbi:hypothetical protein [Azohydromonas australica]|uniref:hypothetical protein n=1 Tax=Azohydromonas australica TaxID=364039 RepID=UPI00041C0FC7|nr:hypothetical protein [Azohydromonas australica]
MKYKALMMAALAGAAVPLSATAQKFSDLQQSSSPLVLKSQGSFYVGGETVTQTAAEIGLYGPGSLVINQMYVQYMVPNGRPKVPVVMVHGATLSGKTYETTPDGRMGWAEYFVRKGHGVYNTDQVSRARSGFNQAPYNDVRAGIVPPQTQANIWRIAAENAWVRFRFGPTYGTPFPDTQFPIAAMEEFAKQAVPDLNTSLPAANPTFKALSELAIQLNGAVLMAHSQGGRFPFEAALIDPSGVKGMIAVEPGGCNGVVYTADQIAALAKLPILVVFGDHLTAPQVFSFVWKVQYDDCKVFIDRINAAGGKARMLYPPDLGIRGNTHMIMQDKNNIQIADLIMQWIDENVGTKR